MPATNRDDVARKRSVLEGDRRTMVEKENDETRDHGQLERNCFFTNVSRRNDGNDDDTRFSEEMRIVFIGFIVFVDTLNIL